VDGSLPTAIFTPKKQNNNRDAVAEGVEGNDADIFEGMGAFLRGFLGVMCAQKTHVFVYTVPQQIHTHHNIHTHKGVETDEAAGGPTLAEIAGLLSQPGKRRK
jgi:hypothetical protein